ncbi:MAG TPA: hypothetical protein VJ302_15680, partial [Blastocatellia bacterium]|nr:hypothetical protein [Blastocatellia bacterium]
RVWEAATGRPLATLRGHVDAVSNAAFSPDGRWIVTTSYDQTAIIYPYEAFAPPEQILERAQQRVLRRLTPTEQIKFGLPDESER